MGQQAGTREAVGVFISAAQIVAARDDLLAAGFEREALGLLASKEVVERFFGPVGSGSVADEATESAAEAELRSIVRHESIGDAAHGWLGALSLAGTTALGAVVVASAAVLGGALVAAAAGVAAMGAMGATMSAIIHKGDAEYLEEQIDDGRLLLFVRTADADQERLALETLSKHDPLDTRMLTIHGPLAP